MKYIIKNKLISIGDGSTVRDEYGNDLFLVRGRVFSPTRFKAICTPDKTPLFTVRNKFFHIFLPKVFLMDANGKILLQIKKRSLFALRQDFEVVPVGDCPFRFTISGNVIGRHYDIIYNGMIVAHVRRNFNLIQDSFWLETEDTPNAALYVAFVIALDNYYDKLMNDDD